MTQADRQARRRHAARARGDCGVCCKRPAEPGRFSCQPCAGIRHAPRPKAPKCPWCKRRKVDHDAEACGQKMREACRTRYARLRLDGLCVHCTAPSPRFARCVACRKADRLRARAAGVPVAAPDRQPAETGHPSTSRSADAILQLQEAMSHEK